MPKAPRVRATTELRRAHRDLAEREGRLRAIIDTEPECVKLLAADGSLLEMNPAGLRIIEADSFEQVKGRCLFPLVAEGHRAAFRDLTDRVFRGESGTLEFEAVGLKGGRRWLETHATPLRDDVGRVAALLGITRDVTRRKLAEERIRQLNRMYLLQSAINQVMVREREPQAIFDAACRIAVEKGGLLMAYVGLADGAAGLRIAAYAGAAPDIRDVLEQIVTDPDGGCAFMTRALATGGHAVCNDIEHDPAAARWREPLLARGYRGMASFPLTAGGRRLGAFNLFAGQGGFFAAEELRLLDELTGNIAFALEGSERERERRRAEAELRASEERFRELAETVREIFRITDPSGDRMVYVSPAYETIWGRSCESLYASPRSWIDAVHPDDRDRVERASATQVALGAFDEEYRIVRPDGEIRWIRDQAFPVRAAEGRVERIVGVARDVTDRRVVQEQMRQAQKMESVGRLAAGVAHDFNNLLTIINSAVEMGLADAWAGTSLREELAAIRDAGARAAELTRQLLAFSRKQVLRPRVVSLNAVVAEGEALLRRVLGEDVRVVVRLAPDLRMVAVDPGQFHQVILNLAANSRDAMPEGGVLTIETRNVDVEPTGTWSLRAPPPGRYVVLEFSDSGLGMDAATREKLFEPFFTTKEPGRGTGLGLATVHGIVSQSGGEIRVDSEIGKGTTFTLYLPAVEGESGSDAAAAAPPSRGTECILVVDDDPGVRAVTTRLLERAGYQVLSAAGGDEALRLLTIESGPVHLLLTDVVMPEMSGRKLAEHLRERHPALRVLFTSGYTDDAILRHGVLEQEVELITKPYATGDLLRKVRQVLEA